MTTFSTFSFSAAEAESDDVDADVDDADYDEAAQHDDVLLEMETAPKETPKEDEPLLRSEEEESGADDEDEDATEFPLLALKTENDDEDEGAEGW